MLGNLEKNASAFKRMFMTVENLKIGEGRIKATGEERESSCALIKIALERDTKLK